LLAERPPSPFVGGDQKAPNSGESSARNGSHSLCFLIAGADFLKDSATAVKVRGVINSFSFAC
jgi:hypothetical protein